MGQQQLLLLVLGIVIVGLAVVVGINAFSENRIKSNADALVTDGLRIVSDVQAWGLKPAQFGGMNAAGGETLASVTWAEIGYPSSNSTDYVNVNGTFSFTGPVSGVSCGTPAAPPSGNAIIVTVYGSNAETGNCITIGVGGTSADDISTDVSYGT
jgi:hypothetical protein